MSHAVPSQLPLSLTLRDGSTFDTFEPGPNGAAVAAMKALATGQGMHPVYLWGEAGNGRSHLLEAAVRQVLEAGGTAGLLHGSELRQVQPAILERLDELTLVAIDRIDLLAGDPGWEEALFHLYNRARAAGGALAFTAAAPPAEAGFRLPDLASRLAAGPVFQLLPLDDAALAALFRQRAAGRGLEVSGELARFVVTRCARVPAALMECLDRLDREALARQRRLTQPFIKQILEW